MTRWVAATKAPGDGADRQLHPRSNRAAPERNVAKRGCPVRRSRIESPGSEISERVRPGLHANSCGWFSTYPQYVVSTAPLANRCACSVRIACFPAGGERQLCTTSVRREAMDHQFDKHEEGHRNGENQDPPDQE